MGQQFGNSRILQCIMNDHAGQRNLSKGVRISTKDKPATLHRKECENM